MLYLNRTVCLFPHLPFNFSSGCLYHDCPSPWIEDHAESTCIFQKLPVLPRLPHCCLLSEAPHEHSNWMQFTIHDNKHRCLPSHVRYHMQSCFARWFLYWPQYLYQIHPADHHPHHHVTHRGTETREATERREVSDQLGRRDRRDFNPGHSSQECGRGSPGPRCVSILHATSHSPGCDRAPIILYDFHLFS